MDTQPPVLETPLIKPRSHKKKEVAKKPKLNLPERLLVLTIDDEHGAVPPSIKAKLCYALVGAVLSEMILKNKIRLENSRLVLNDSGAFGEPWFDEILATIASEQRPRKVSHWLVSMGKKETLNQLAERLAEHNVITIEKKKYLWIIPYEAFPKINASAKYWVKQELRSIGLAGEKAELYDIAFLDLLKECQLLSLVFTRDERRSVSKKIKAFFNDEGHNESDTRLLAEIEVLIGATAALAID